jgi:hypothetical protein
MGTSLSDGWRLRNTCRIILCHMGAVYPCEGGAAQENDPSCWITPDGYSILLIGKLILRLAMIRALKPNRSLKGICKPIPSYILIGDLARTSQTLEVHFMEHEAIDGNCHRKEERQIERPHKHEFWISGLWVLTVAVLLSSEA